MERISKYISWQEATKSNTAIKYGIDNTPNAEQLANMKYVAQIFDKVREYMGEPLIVSSFFRHEKLNKKLGGSSTSFHVQGCAIDIDSNENLDNRKIFEFIRDNCTYSELIAEFIDETSKQPQWVHVGWKKGDNSKETLIATKDKKGKTVYVPYTKELFEKIYGK